MEKLNPENKWHKIIILTGITGLTLAFHYGLIVEPIFGHIHWIHVIHGRLCYIPIVVAATWFGIRGGLFAATVISLLLMPYIFGIEREMSDLVQEFAEIAFYFAIAVLAGALVEREFRIRRRHQDAKLQLERSQKFSLVGQVAAGVAHEIKNPLASIKGAVEILSDEGTSPAEKAEFQEIFIREIRRIDNTIAEFLNFARPKETKLVKLDLPGTLRNCIRQMEPQARRQQISIEGDLPDNIFILGDAEKIHQLTLNLIVNSIQACSPGTTIKIVLRVVGAQMARVTLTDTGPGIDEEDLDKVFEPFYTTKTAGTGLGLAIVQSIVENHHGTIDLRSRPGQGTTVIITFPVYKE